MALLVDTDVLIDFERAGDLAIPEDEDIAISVITASELLHGVERATGDARTQRQAFVEAVLDAADPIPVTVPVARIHARIWATLAESGSVIGAHDLWIAATAIAHGLGLATRNVGEFTRVDGLRVVEVAG